MAKASTVSACFLIWILGSSGGKAYEIVATPKAEDLHGSRGGTGFSGTLKSPYTRGAATPCPECHTTHGPRGRAFIRTEVNGQTGVSVSDSNTAKTLCAACHDGDASVWHLTCIVQCHADPAPSDPHPGFGVWRIPDTNAPCLDCHGHGKSFRHTSTCLNCHSESELRQLGVPGPFPAWTYHTF